MHCGYIITPPSLSRPSCLPLRQCLFVRLFDREVQEHRRHLVNLSEVTHILSVSWFVLEVLVTMINHPIGWNNNNNNFLDNHPPTSLIGDHS